jgi:hypothetical protein
MGPTLQQYYIGCIIDCIAICIFALNDNILCGHLGCREIIVIVKNIYLYSCTFYWRPRRSACRSLEYWFIMFHGEEIYQVFKMFRSM